MCSPSSRLVWADFVGDSTSLCSALFCGAENPWRLCSKLRIDASNFKSLDGIHKEQSSSLFTLFTSKVAFSRPFCYLLESILTTLFTVLSTLSSLSRMTDMLLQRMDIPSGIVLRDLRRASRTSSFLVGPLVDDRLRRIASFCCCWTPSVQQKAEGRKAFCFWVRWILRIGRKFCLTEEKK